MQHKRPVAEVGALPRIVPMSIAADSS